jgi:hypothetical protein
MTTDIVSKLEGFLPSDGTLHSATDCLAFDALAEIRRLRGEIRRLQADNIGPNEMILPLNRKRPAPADGDGRTVWIPARVVPDSSMHNAVYIDVWTAKVGLGIVSVTRESPLVARLNPQQGLTELDAVLRLSAAESTYRESAVDGLAQIDHNLELLARHADALHMKTRS